MLIIQTWWIMLQKIDILAVNLNAVYNYFNSIKLFLDLYSAKFLNASAKLFFSCKNKIIRNVIL